MCDAGAVHRCVMQVPCISAFDHQVICWTAAMQAIAEFREEDAEWQLAKRPMRSLNDAGKAMASLLLYDCPKRAWVVTAMGRNAASKDTKRRQQCFLRKHCCLH